MKIEYQFKNAAFLEEALTHSSYGNERKFGGNNERLEFLGDSILSLVVSRYLFTKFTDMPEGKLTKMRAALVCEKSLFEFAKEIDLGSSLYLGKGEENTGGRTRPSVLADAFEALIAAIYLDSGFDEAEKFVLKFVNTDTIDITDYKSLLQEIVQRNPEEKICYAVVDEMGPSHSKIFKVEVRLNSNLIGQGSGKTKKQAEQIAAKEALALMGVL